MSLKNITLGHTASLHLRHPGTDALLYCDDKSPMTIDLVGEHSEEYKATTRRWQNETLRRPGRKLSAEQIEERSLDLLVAVTKGWHLQWDDGMLPFSPQQARDIYGDREYGWIKSQVEAYVFEQANFLGESWLA